VSFSAKVGLIVGML